MSKKTEWDTGIKIIKSVDVFIPQKINNLCNHICDVIGDSEFSIYLKYTVDEDGDIMVEDDFYVPSQEVSAAKVDYNEAPPDESWNAVLHRHPDGCDNFSSTDEEYINANFPLSLLYTEPKGIFKGVYNIPHGLNKIQLPIDVNIMETLPEIDDDMLKEKIQKYVYKPVVYTPPAYTPTSYLPTTENERLPFEVPKKKDSKTTSVVSKMSVAGYYLFVQDALRIAKEQGYKQLTSEWIAIYDFEYKLNRQGLLCRKTSGRDDSHCDFKFWSPTRKTFVSPSECLNGNGKFSLYKEYNDDQEHDYTHILYDEYSIMFFNIELGTFDDSEITYQYE